MRGIADSSIAHSLWLPLCRDRLTLEVRTPRKANLEWTLGKELQAFFQITEILVFRKPERYKAIREAKT
jgi:hypothetical protein